MICIGEKRTQFHLTNSDISDPRRRLRITEPDTQLAGETHLLLHVFSNIIVPYQRSNRKNTMEALRSFFAAPDPQAQVRLPTRLSFSYWQSLFIFRLFG